MPEVVASVFRYVDSNDPRDGTRANRQIIVTIGLRVSKNRSKSDCPSRLVSGNIDPRKSQLQFFNFTDVYV